MIPVQLDGRTKWPMAAAQEKFRILSREVSEDMVRKSRAKFESVCAELKMPLPKGTQCYRVVEGKTNGPIVRGGTIEVDPVLSRFRHSGRDYIREVQRRWYAFCASPQNHEEVDIPGPSLRGGGSFDGASADGYAPKRRGRPPKVKAVIDDAGNQSGSID